MSDGGHVCLDWYNVNTSDQPTVLFLPGITGMHSIPVLIPITKTFTVCVLKVMSLKNR